MDYIINIYLALLAAFLLWNIVPGLWEEELPGFVDMLIFIFYPCTVLCVGMYISPRIVERLGGWSTFAITYATLGMCLWLFVTVYSFINTDEEKEEEEQENGGISNEQPAAGVLDLDGDDPTYEEKMLATGKEISQLFSPTASTTDKLSALASLGKDSEEEDDEKLITYSEKLLFVVGSVLFLPAVVLGYLA